jgi:tetratricopeptide (TPR) repeat protein
VILRNYHFLLLSFLPFCTQAQDEYELNNKGVKLINEENYEAALPYFNELIDKSSDNNPLYYANRAVILFNLKRYSEALADYEFLIKALPNESENYFQTGNIYDQQDSLAKAAYFYTKAISVDKDQFIYYFKRGTIYLKQMQWKNSIDDFNAAIDLNPEHDNSFHNRAIAYYKAGFKEKGCEDWCQALLKGNTKSAVHLEKNCEKYPSPCLLTK